MEGKKRKQPDIDFYADTMEREEITKKNYGLNREKGAFTNDFEKGLNREKGVFNSTAVFVTNREENR